MIKYISVILGVMSLLMTANSFANTLNDEQKDMVDRVVIRLYTHACKTELTTQQCTNNLKSHIILITSLANHPKIKRNLTTVALLNAIIAGLQRALPVSTPVTPSTGINSGSLISEMLGLINQERVRAQLKPITSNTLLNKAAQQHANYMAQTDDFAHVSKSGQTPVNRVDAVGYTWTLVGENIAFGTQTAEATMEAWMDSPTHKANILNPEFTEVGIAEAGDYRVQLFGSRE